MLTEEQSAHTLHDQKCLDSTVEDTGLFNSGGKMLQLVRVAGNR